MSPSRWPGCPHGHPGPERHGKVSCHRVRSLKAYPQKTRAGAARRAEEARQAMSTHQDRSVAFSAEVGEASVSDVTITGSYHPSRAFRQLLRRRKGARPLRSERVLGPPGWLPLLGATLAVGVAAGFLELAVVLTQLHGLHRI